MGHVAELLVPIYDRLVEQLMSGFLIHLDGTGLTVLTPGKKGQYRGQIAVYCNADITAYQFTPSKHGHYFVAFLGLDTDDGFSGHLVVDAASNMNVLFDGTGLTECGCWFHARDKFKRARDNAPFKAQEAIAWIHALFEIEHEADDASDTAEERLSRRRRESEPILRQFYGWLDEVGHAFARDEEMAKAVRYCRNHREPLRRFLTDGRIPLTNNLAERELGVIGRGRKAYLFAGSDEGARRLAINYTIVRTCERMGIDPFAYLSWVLPRLSDLPVNRGKGHLAELMPAAFMTINAE